MTLDEFVQQDIEQSGRSVYTMQDVEELTRRWIEFKKAAAAPFEGWRSDDEIDALLFGQKEAA